MREARLLALGVLALALAMPGRARADDEPEPEKSEPESAPEKEPEPESEPPKAPRAHVVLRTTQPVMLMQRKAGTKEWITACESPCEKDLPLADEYRVTGQGLRPSNDFNLEARAGDTVEIQVRPSTKFTWEVGVIIGGGGVLVDIVAVYLLIVALAVDVGDCTSNGAFVSIVAQGVCRGKPTPGALQALSLIALIPGTAAAIGGLATASSSWTTRFTQQVSRPPALPAPSAFLRSSETPERQWFGTPGFVSLPLGFWQF